MAKSNSEERPHLVIAPKGEDNDEAPWDEEATNPGHMGGRVTIMRASMRTIAKQIEKLAGATNENTKAIRRQFWAYVITGLVTLGGFVLLGLLVWYTRGPR